MRTRTAVLVPLAGAALAGAAAVRAEDRGKKAGVEKMSFGKMPGGTPVDLYVLTNANGMTVKITNYGGTVTEIHPPDRGGKFADVALGFDNLGDYLKNNPFFGCIVGRYANRIAGGKFTLHGKEYTLAKNNGPNSLHGGLKGFDKKLWQAEPVRDREG